MVGGRGLDKFRENMVNDKRIKYLFDFENASDCFQGVHIDGGVCYFLWDKAYKGTINYTFKSNDGSVNKTKRLLNTNHFKYVIRDIRILSIVEKVSRGDSFSNLVSNTKPYGIRKYLFNEPHRYPYANLQSKPFKNSVKIYGVKGLKGGAKRKNGYISLDSITNNQDSIDKYKLFFTTSYSTNAVIPPKIIIGNKQEVCTETFLLIGPFKNKEEQKNCLSYMETKFFRALLYFGKGSMQVTKTVFGLIPNQDFSNFWNDDKLYKKYSLNGEEINFIESMMRPMEINNE